MSMSSSKQADAVTLQPDTQDADCQETLVSCRIKSQIWNCQESAAKSAFKDEKKVRNAAEDKQHLQTDAVEPEQEKDVEMEQEKAQSIRRDGEEYNVNFSSVSPHDSNFDLLQMNTDSDFSVPMSSPHCRDFVRSFDTRLMSGPLASPSLSSCGSSALCSPSRFFKSPLRTSIQTLKTPPCRELTPIRLATPKRLSDTIDLLCQQEEKKTRPTTSEDGMVAAATLVDIELKQGNPRENVMSTRARLRKESTVAAPPRTPTLSAKQQLLSCCQKGVVDRTKDVKEREIARDVPKTPARTSSKAYTSALILDADDVQCVPSELMTSSSENDSFFSFVSLLSPLMPADEFEDILMPAKLSPLVPLSYDLPRPLSPYPKQEPSDDRGLSSTTHAYNGTTSIIQTPKKKSSRKRRHSSTQSLAGGGICVHGSASRLISPRFFTEPFPNIQAFTNATPGQDERSKLGSHSVMKIKLHTSFGSFSSMLDSHPTRKIQTINNSLKRKKYIRRRKGQEERLQTSFSSNVQRKLLQTPVKSSDSPRTIARSPLHPWNGQTSQASVLKAHTPQKSGAIQQTTKVAADEALAYSPVARRQISATDPVPAPVTPVGNKKKRKTSQCVSMPSSVANIVGVKMRKSVLNVREAAVLAATPTKQIKQEVTTSPGKHNMLTPRTMIACDTNDMASFESSVLQTPAHVGLFTSLTTSLQSTSKAVLGAPSMVMPSQVSKKASCNCKKSKCLKLYCECFRLGEYCDESCNCHDCANTTKTEAVRQQAIASRLEKNPNAFKPKIGATPAAVTSTSENAHRLSVGTSSSSHVSIGSLMSPPGQTSFQQQQRILGAGVATIKMHKHGCHCKKSACQKKYCECFQAGVRCGDNCRCIECKNQISCVAHGNGVAIAESALGGAPTRIANELDETFVSPVLQGVRQRMRIDRETWRENFSSPFKSSPKRKRDRTEWSQSKLLASRNAGVTGARVRAVPFASESTPPVKSQSGARQSRGILSPIRGQCDEQRGGNSKATNTLMSPKERELQQHHCADRIDDKTVGKAALSAVVRSSSPGIERVFVLPLFGSKLVPLENGVSAKIFCFLTNADLHNASLVNHLWNQVALGDTVWDHANYISTKVNAAAGRCSPKKTTGGSDDARI
ncbi:unnamed protein product [Peronospora belbahrii]|uniref:CRC domain-containing protein n=1 Tax=Peronospora belbahrii TaxID=622444 RepID=A0ABN8D4G3_9STRA|nr:unnamed protein product [Peronospora belbahrii]